MNRHANKGLRFGINRAQLMKYGNVCYASIKNSFVIGSDAKIYKCTVSFDKEENQIGRLNDDGTMTIDDIKFKYWTERKEKMNHDLCKKCDVYPTCLGIYCGLNNISLDGEFLCAGLKNYIDDYLEHISRVDNYVIDLGGDLK